MRLRLARRAVVVFLCATLLAHTLPPFPRAEAAQGNEDKNKKEANKEWVVRMEIGQPSIWSLAQAHYLLGQMHDRNRDLVAKRPGEDTLDPNRINASRLEILRTLLGVEAQFDQSVGVKNEIELDKFREKQAARTQAQALLTIRKTELQELDEKILELSLSVAEFETRSSFAATPPSEEDRQRKIDLAREKKRLELLQAERTRLATEITSLEGVATGDVVTPTLTTPTLSADTAGATGTLPASEALTGFVEKALANVGTPNLSASIALDNYVHIQYEIIAKQLTLLRDEVGPDERVVFLELPASLYTVDKWANRYIAQVNWEVTEVYDEEPSPEVQREVICRDLRGEGKSSAAILSILENLKGMKSRWYDTVRTSCLKWIQWEAMKRIDPQEAAVAPKDGVYSWRLNEWKVEEDANLKSKLAPITVLFENKNLKKENQEWRHRDAVRKSVYRGARYPDDWQAREYPVTLDMIRLDQERKKVESGHEEVKEAEEREKEDKEEIEKVRREKGSRAADKLERELAEKRSREEKGEQSTPVRKVRTLEIIPRQSALNVNQYHASTSYKGFLGVLKLLSGFGAKVNYQSQREMYENFLQQEIFASGFGKGLNSFGWTFGPQPGSKRISPGQRTTYAVLAVPKNALALKLEAKGSAFRKRWEPEHGEVIDQQEFMIRVPNDKTERFWVESVSYTPARQGPVTVLLRGNYFSPQIGVLINGVPLKRSVSISRATISDPPFVRTNSGVEGEYEVTNSREMALNFSMGPGFVGTPIITLITPERATTINSFNLEINFRRRLEKLEDISERIPMFADKLELTPKLEELGPQEVGCNHTAKCKQDGFQLARLKGKGFLPDAQIRVGGANLEFKSVRSKLKELIHKREAFAFQESTGSYIIFFKKPEGKRWKIRFQQATKQGIEESEFEHVLPAGVDFGHKIRNYRRVPGKPFAEVDLTFVVPEARDNKETTIAVTLDQPLVPDGCTRHPLRDKNDDFRVSCSIPFEGGVERDFISLRVIPAVPETKKNDPKDAGGDGEVGKGKDKVDANRPPVYFADIQLPISPHVREFGDLLTGRPRADSRYDVKAVLRGDNLNRVTGVLFGDQSAKIVSRPAGVLVVEVPRLKVEPGQETVVPLVLQTDTGALSTGFFFTYEGPPEPKK